MHNYTRRNFGVIREAPGIQMNLANVIILIFISSELKKDQLQNSAMNSFK